MIRSITGYGAGNGPMIAVHEGFIGIAEWTDFMGGADRLYVLRPFVVQQEPHLTPAVSWTNTPTSHSEIPTWPPILNALPSPVAGVEVPTTPRHPTASSLAVNGVMPSTIAVNGSTELEVGIAMTLFPDLGDATIGRIGKHGPLLKGPRFDRTIWLKWTLCKTFSFGRGGLEIRPNLGIRLARSGITSWAWNRAGYLPILGARRGIVGAWASRAVR
jgi:hypothetical protein